MGISYTLTRSGIKYYTVAMRGTEAESKKLEALGPVPKTTLTERVATILRRFILMENLQEGDLLPSERQLAATLGVSHRVVRGSLNILVGEGIVAKQHGRGNYVRAFDRERVRTELVVPPTPFSKPADLLQARCAIEIGMMPIAVAQATEEDLTAMQNAIDALKRNVEQGGSATPDDLRFHRTLLAATHNEILQHLEHMITESIRIRVYHLPALLHRGVSDESHIVDAHQAIADAIRERDATKAILAMQSHLQRTLYEVVPHLRTLESEPDDSEDRS